MQDYEKQCVITPAPDDLQISYSPFEPPYPDVKKFFYGFFTPYIQPYEYTGWRDEQLSWEKTVYLHAGLSCAPYYRFQGPGATDFLKKYCTCTFDKFAIGTGKHCITCDENGMITSHGMLFRMEENVYDSYFMLSLFAHSEMEKGNYDMETLDLTGTKYLFQIGGPRSLELLEKVTGEDLHDIKFMRFRQTSIDGKKMRIARMGMAGTLSYELHGDVQDSYELYDRIYQAGEEFGIRRLGWHTYMMEHTICGYPQTSYHFTCKIPGFPDNAGAVSGSVGRQATGYTDPYSLGWGFCVKFDHDFIGRAALEKMAAAPKRDTVSLVWNKDDVLKVYESQFTADPNCPIDEPNDLAADYRVQIHQDKVLDSDGNEIGISSGRMMSLYYNEMVSQCQLDIAFCKEGKEVYVLWGEPDTKQIKIRATVERFPYYNENRNNEIDVATIPRYVIKEALTEITGTYSIVCRSPLGASEGSFEYKVVGSELTGTATAMGSTVEITNGLVNGNDFSHYMKMQTPMGKMKMKVVGKLDGDRISGSFKSGLINMPFEGKKV